MKAPHATLAVNIAAAALAFALPTHSSAAANRHVATVAVNHSAPRLMPPPGPHPFFEAYPTPLNLLINLINNPPQCECPTISIGMNFSQFVQILGQPSSLNGSTATWSNHTTGNNGNQTISSSEKLSVQFDGNGNALGIGSQFKQIGIQ